MEQGTTSADKPFSMAIDFEESDSTAPLSYVSGLSSDDQDDEFDEYLTNNRRDKIRDFYNSHGGSKGGRIFRQVIGGRDSSGICDRLYYEAKEKQKKRANEIREKLKEENKYPPKLKLATERSYTPMKSRSSSEEVHNNLYSLAVKKKEEQNKDNIEDHDTEPHGPTISSKQGEIVSGRLYERSKDMQEEGRKMRKEIEEKLAPRAPTPSKRMPLSQATAMYERGLTYKAQREKKIDHMLNAPRESTFPKMASQRSNSSNRTRSETPSRRNSDRRSETPSRRCATPSRRSETPSRRSETPSKRASTPSRKQMTGNGNNFFQKSNKNTPQQRNKLPPAPSLKMKTRGKSPDLR